MTDSFNIISSVPESENIEQMMNGLKTAESVAINVLTFERDETGKGKIMCAVSKSFYLPGIPTNSEFINSRFRLRTHLL